MFVYLSKKVKFQQKIQIKDANKFLHSTDCNTQQHQAELHSMEWRAGLCSGWGRRWPLEGFKVGSNHHKRSPYCCAECHADDPGTGGSAQQLIDEPDAGGSQSRRSSGHLE